MRSSNNRVVLAVVVVAVALEVATTMFVATAFFSAVFINQHMSLMRCLRDLLPRERCSSSEYSGS